MINYCNRVLKEGENYYRNRKIEPQEFIRQLVGIEHFKNL